MILYYIFPVISFREAGNQWRSAGELRTKPQLRAAGFLFEVPTGARPLANDGPRSKPLEEVVHRTLKILPCDEISFDRGNFRRLHAGLPSRPRIFSAGVPRPKQYCNPSCTILPSGRLDAGA